MKIKKGDMVKVLAGKDRNKTGKVVQVLVGKNSVAYVVVEGVNKLKKHMRSRGSENKGQTIELPAPMPASRVMIIDSKTNKPTRVNYRIDGKTKTRVGRKSGEALT